MAATNVNVAQDLNNAIYSLASLNPGNVLANRLNDDWQEWYSNYRTLPIVFSDLQWWATFKGYWVTYATARSQAPNLNERTPNPEEIDPTLWKTLLSDMQARDVLLNDVSREAREAARAKLDEAGAAVQEKFDEFGNKLKQKIFDASKPAIFVSVVIGIALIASSMRGGRR